MLNLAKVIQAQMLTMQRLCAVLLLFVSVQSSLWAEPSHVAPTQAEEALLLNKVLPQQPATTQLQSLGNNPSHQAQSNSAQRQSNSQNPSAGVAATQANDQMATDQMVNLPSLNAPIIDQANILTTTEKQNLSQQILKIHQQGKAQIGMVIVPSTGPESIFDFAMRVGEQWKLGSSKSDNGLIIAVAVDDRRVNIATGYGLEGVLPDIVAGQIIRNQIEPQFKQAQYGQGLQAALNEIERVLNLDPEIAQKAAAELEQRQHAAMQAEAAKDKIYTTSVVIFLVGAFASMFIGKRISAATAGVTGFAAGLIYGSGFIMSLLVGFGLFILIITPLAQLILQMFLSGGGRGGGRGGGGGGGYGGGGGRFGGGGASGSW